MLLNAHDLAGGQLVEADIAIVGGGACGITLARRLAAAGHQVVLLEGGGTEYDEATQALYQGVAEGTPWADGEQYLISSRLRYLGGTTNHWAGWCRPMDPIDFERRDWMPHSGWPIDYATMEPYFRGAEKVLEVRPFAESRGSDYGGWDLFAGTELLTKEIFHLSTPVRFRIKYGDELAAAQRVRVILHANVTHVGLAADGRSVRRLEVASTPERRFEVRAGLYVLAAGGVENARLLLASDDVHRSGVGNVNDLVGRFFMDHPHRRLGTALLWTVPENLYEYRSRPRQWGDRFPVMSLSEAYRREHGLAGVTVQIVKKQRADPADPVVRSVAALDSLRDATWRRDGAPVTAVLNLRSEQVPNPQSQVVLGDDVDPFGLRRVHLDWRLQAEDLRTIREMERVVAAELARTGVARVQSHIDPDEPWSGTDGGDHHIGTTRMAASAADGVVDPDSRVFGVENLYVAGSSVYPTCGFVNPTFTLVALTLRLSDHLERRLQSA